jgi:hypothetical protein
VAGWPLLQAPQERGRRQALASPAGYVRKDEFTSASERSAVGCLPLAGGGQGDPFDAAFDIYIDDLLDCLHECATEDAVALGEALIAALPMRTTSLLCPSPEGLQRHIDTVVAWLRKWRMAANTVKSQTMIIHPRLMSRLQ